MTGLFSNQASLHKNYRESNRLQVKQDIIEGDIARIPLEIVQNAGCDNDQMVGAAASSSSFTSKEAVDAASISVRSIQGELDRLSFSNKAELSFHIPKDLLGYVMTDPSDPAIMSSALQDIYGTSRHRHAPAGLVSTVSATEAAHRFACDQVAVDLALSRDVLFSEGPAPVPEGSSNKAMTSYDRVTELPDVEYGYFKPIDAQGNTPSSDAARALLSEWTLGADPSIRPAFVNPYGQQIKDQKVANTQLKAFKTRIAAGVGVSASQPLPGTRSRPSRPNMGRLPEMKRRGEDDGEALGVERNESSSQYQPEAQIPSSTQAETQPAPFTQMLPGAHGGRPAVKKKKKRTGGF